MYQPTVNNLDKTNPPISGSGAVKPILIKDNTIIDYIETLKQNKKSEKQILEKNYTMHALRVIEAEGYINALDHLLKFLSNN